IGSFSAQLRKAYTSAGDRQVALYINDQWVADSQIFGSPTGADPTIHLFEVNDINIQGNVVIEIRHIQGGSTNRQLTIDNIGWTAYGAGNTVATPVFTPPTGLYTTPQSVSITCTTESSTIHYTIDGSVPTPTSPVYSTPITISNTTVVKAMAVADGYTNSNVATATYTFPVAVADLSALRSMPPDGVTVYQVTNPVILSFQQVFRNQKFVQDNTAGILIDDLAGVVTTTYNLYDGITGIAGKITEYGGMIQFTPAMNFPPASSANNTIVPVSTTYQELVDNFDDYESRVIRIEGISFATPGSFANGVVYETSSGGVTYNFRTTFYDVDYIGTTIPQTPKDIVGIPNSRVDGDYFTARFASDFQDPSGTVSAPSFDPPAGVYFGPINVSLSCATPNSTIYYTTDGSDPSSSSAVYSTPLQVSSNTTLKAIAYVPEMPPSAINTANYVYPITVSTIAELRQQATGSNYYRLMGEAVVTFTQSYRNQKYVQDNTAGILIDDFEGVIASQYNLNDGFLGLTGQLSEYNGMLELIPALDPGPPSSNYNFPPVDVTLQDLTDNFEQYESRLVRVTGACFQDEGDFVNGQIYQITNLEGTQSFNFRTTFYDVEYIGSPIPQLPVHGLIGIPNSRAEGDFLTSRFESDIDEAEIYAPFLEVWPNGTIPPPYATLSWTYGDEGKAERIIPWGVTGIRIYRNDVMIHETNEIQGSYTDADLEYIEYTYFVTAVFFDEYESAASNSVLVNWTANEDTSAPGLQTALQGNYPNPFNPSTTIKYSLKEASAVELGIFNLKGQKICSLVNGILPSGNHTVTWNGQDAKGSTMPSGIYYLRLETRQGTSTRKIMLMK
ncbi:MAG: chitobiase/beta-hexosaminidase C-terminal domain-containing protein, partial [Candidatus Cloacimonetes bacterium]|nr:chitobiase/beta-hexosaminidase C-terminal domain-containing protein [Candidatus Cloacimonadota bacterium]